MSASDIHAAAIKGSIKKGYVLHIDPDYLIHTYGDITTGTRPDHTIHPRYALCVGVEGIATFWVLLTTSPKDGDQVIPEQAKIGSWAHNAKTSYFDPKQLFVATKDMITEAHLHVNTAKARFEHSGVKLDGLVFPPLPVTGYPKLFVPIAHRNGNGHAKSAPVATPKTDATKALWDKLLPEPPQQPFEPVPVMTIPGITPLPPTPREAIVAGGTPLTPAPKVEPTPAPKVEPTPAPKVAPGDYMAWMIATRGKRGRAEVGAVMGISHHTLMRAERGEILLAPDELAAWATCHGILPGDPMLAQVPVLDEAGVARRLDYQARCEKRQKHVPAEPPTVNPNTAPQAVPSPEPEAPAPAPEPEVPEIEPVPAPALTPQPKKSSAQPAPKRKVNRKALVTALFSTLDNPRLTDEEVEVLIENLEADAHLLLHNLTTIKALRR